MCVVHALATSRVEQRDPTDDASDVRLEVTEESGPNLHSPPEWNHTSRSCAVVLGLRYRSMADAARRAALRFERWFTSVHPRIYVATGGWLGHRLGWYPSLVLETTGRRSGLARSVVLPYLPHGDAYLTVASNFGGDRNPDWLLNLKSEPNVRVRLRRKQFTATAEAVFPGDGSYDQLWRIVTKDGRRGPYERYRTLTARPIPVVRIARSSGSEIE